MRLSNFFRTKKLLSPLQLTLWSHVLLLQISATFTVADIIPSSKTIANLKFPNYESGKVPAAHFSQYVTFRRCFKLKYFLLYHAARVSILPSSCISHRSCWSEPSSSTWFFSHPRYSHLCFGCRGRLWNHFRKINKIHGWHHSDKTRFICFSNSVSHYMGWWL